MATPTAVFVMTVDQRGSRRRPDEVPTALRVLDGCSRRGFPPVLAPERTAGDEFQTLYDDPWALVTATEALTRLGGWRIGVGIGEIEHPLPESTRAARGPAFIAAREAVDRARLSSGHLAVRTAGDTAPPTVVGAHDYRRLRPVDAAEHALTLLVATLTRRTKAGWEIVDLIESGMNGRQAAERLGISESAVSQRLARASHDEGVRARTLAAFLLSRAQEAS